MKNALQCWINDVASWAYRHPFAATLSGCFLAAGAVPAAVSVVFILTSVVVGLVSWIACQLAVIVVTLVGLSFFLCLALCCSGCATTLLVSGYYALKALGLALDSVRPSCGPSPDSAVPYQNKSGSATTTTTAEHND